MTEIVALPDAAADLEAAADRGVFVVTAVERAKNWLEEALSHGDLNALANTKGYAECLRVATMQKQLGKDAELAATELVRRAERAIGIGIRRGQERGQVLSRGSNLPRETLDKGFSNPPSPSDFATKGELNPGSGQAGIYDLTDDVTDEQFEEAMAEAKDEGNLSRANVARKAGKLKPKPTKRPEVLRGTRHFDHYRIVDQTVAMSGISTELYNEIDFENLDASAEDLDHWVSSLNDAINSLNKLRRQLKELTQ